MRVVRELYNYYITLNCTANEKNSNISHYRESIHPRMRNNSTVIYMAVKIFTYNRCYVNTVHLDF